MEELDTENSNEELQVHLMPLPGSTSAWAARFQYGHRGEKKGGHYVSAQYMLTHEEAANILVHMVKHTRSFRPGSTAIYTLVEDTENNWPLPISYAQLIYRLKNPTGDECLTDKHKELTAATIQEMTNEALVIAEEMESIEEAQTPDNPFIEFLKEKKKKVYH